MTERSGLQLCPCLGCGCALQIPGQQTAGRAARSGWHLLVRFVAFGLKLLLNSEQSLGAVGPLQWA